MTNENYNPFLATLIKRTELQKQPSFPIIQNTQALSPDLSVLEQRVTHLKHVTQPNPINSEVLLFYHV